MNRFILSFIFVIITFIATYSQTDSENSFGINVKGFVKTDVMLDTRQTVTAREGHFLLYPTIEATDANGDDINEGVNLNMLSIQSRVTGVITAPDFLGAKSSGVL